MQIHTSNFRLTTQAPLGPLETFVKVLLVLLALAIIIWTQVPHLSRPPFDAHSFRQSQTWSTIEIYNANGIELMKPRTNYIGEPGVFVLEFPAYQAASAFLMKSLGDSIIIARCLNLFITCATAGVVFLLGRRMMGTLSGLLAVTLYLSAPLNLTYMSSVLIDPLAILTAFLTFYFAVRLLEDFPPKKIWLFPCFCMLAIVTALIKALYLFPVLCIIALGFCGGQNCRKCSTKLLAGIIPAGICFMLWSHYAGEVNSASFFTKGVSPLSLLGWDKLFSQAWAVTMAKRFVGICAGPFASLLILFGWTLAILETLRKRKIENFGLVTFLLGGCVMGYWLVFPNINFFHDYYSLMTTPYLALAGTLVVARLVGAIDSNPAIRKWTTPVFIICALLCVGGNILFFTKRNVATPITTDRHLLTLQAVAGNAFRHGDYAMVFVQTSISPGGGNLGSSPAAMAALGLLGTSTNVDNAQFALQRWNDFRPHYRHLRYVVFYGLPPVPEITKEFSVPMLINDVEKVYGFTLPNFKPEI